MKYVSKINEMALSDPAGLIEKAELRYSECLDDIAQSIFEAREKRIVMLAGPSASGKTTTAGLIAERLGARGAKAFTVSLDDFYHNQRDAILGEDGKPDYETVRALDVELIDSCLDEIIRTGTTRLPRFDFASGTRSGFSQPITLGKDDVLIVEGIHALNPVITDELPDDNLMKLYVSVSSRIADDRGEVIMSKRDLRFVRRLVRDYYHRASSVERTYGLWDSVQRGEDKYIFPFSHLAAAKIDSLHAYEPCVFRTLAVPMLESVAPGSEWFNEAHMMTEKLKAFAALPTEMIPASSLLREFMQ